MPEDAWAVACNYTIGTSIAAVGARAFAIPLRRHGMGYEHVEVIARSRGGRRVAKWEDIRRLSWFRVACIPVEHPMRHRMPMLSRSDAEDFARQLN